MESLIVTAIYGGVAGFVYGVVGYFKNRSADNMFKEFDISKFGSTVLGSAIIGAGAAYSGMAYDVFAASAMGVVITQFAKSLFNGLKVYLAKK